MAVAYRAGAVGGTTTNTSTGLSITVPTSGSGGTVIAGDVAFACIATGGNNTFVAAPSGWTQRALTANAQSNITGAIYSKTLVSGDINAAAAWTLNAANTIAASIDIVSGASESSTTYSAMTVGTGTTVTSPTITITSGGFDFGFWIGAITAGAAFTFTKDATYTAASTRASSVVSGQNRTMGTAFISGVSGSTAGVGCTFSASTNRNAVFSIAIAPGTPVLLTGAVADLAIAPFAGTVATGTASDGTVAQLLLSPFNGVFSTPGSAAGNSPPGVALAPLAGTVTAAQTLAGALSDVAISAPVGNVHAGTTSAGPVADLAITAPVGAFGISVPVTLGGFVADLAILPASGDVIAQRPKTLAGPVGTFVIAPLAGVLAVQAQVEGINAVVNLAALNGDVTGGFGATLAGPTATVSLAGLHGFAGVLRNISLSLRAMSDDWSAGEPTDSNHWAASNPSNNSWQAGEVSR